jgi:hypothetical protein
MGHFSVEIMRLPGQLSVEINNEINRRNGVNVMMKCYLPFSEKVTDHVEAFKCLSEIIEEFSLFPDTVRFAVDSNWSGTEEEQEEWTAAVSPDDPRMTYGYAAVLWLVSQDIDTLINKGRERKQRLIQTMFANHTILFVDDIESAEDIYQELKGKDELTAAVKLEHLQPEFENV